MDESAIEEGGTSCGGKQQPEKHPGLAEHCNAITNEGSEYLALPVERPPEGEDQVDHLLSQSPEGKDDPVGHPVHILLSTQSSIQYLKVIAG